VFFMQAEDGIRDWSVTGVQTCALPIFIVGAHSVLRRALRKPRIFSGILQCAPQHGMRADDENASQILVALLGDRPQLLLAPGRRSEERRVGKEWRAEGWAGEWRVGVGG